MNGTMAEVLAAETALLEQLVPTPVEPFGYGVDWNCADDVTENFDDLDPDSLLGLGQALYHRQTTERGTLPDDPDYGFDVVTLLHLGMSPVDVRAAEGRIAAELLKDDRVSAATVTITITGESMRIVERITPENPDLAEFSLTLAVVDGKALLEAIS